VSGKARRKPLNVFSPISWYVSLSEIWYLPSSSSINANIFVEAMDGVAEATADGSSKETV